MDDLLHFTTRLIDFDNVRPSNALVNFLFTTPGLSKRDVWRFIEPVMQQLLDDLAVSPDIGSNLINFGQLKRPLLPPEIGPPYPLMEARSTFLGDKNSAQPLDEEIQDQQSPGCDRA
jgi:hypothetical protein